MPLHIDYRPENFAEVIGNEATIKGLESVLSREDKPHSFLFQGPSGCGKTTFARIIKDKLKCHDQDFIEINSANSRGIDTAREIIQTSNYMPVAGPVRVILMDEVHMGTKDFQTALLKPLEDTPEHVYFILCTTDPQKLLLTVRNRCTTFDVNKLSNNEIEQLLVWVLNKEKVDINEEAFIEIVKSAEGCPRQVLVMLDQIIDLPKEEQEKAIREIAIGDKQIIDLCRALIKQESSWPKIAKIIKNIKEEPEKVRYAVLGYMNTALLGGSAVAALIIYNFREPMFYQGRAGLTLACWESIDEEKRVDDISF